MAADGGLAAPPSSSVGGEGAQALSFSTLQIFTLFVTVSTPLWQLMVLKCVLSLRNKKVGELQPTAKLKNHILDSKVDTDAVGMPKPETDGVRVEHNFSPQKKFGDPRRTKFASWRK